MALSPARDANRFVRETAALLLAKGIVRPDWFASGGALQLQSDLKGAILATHADDRNYVVKRRADDSKAAALDSRLRREAVLLEIFRDSEIEAVERDFFPRLVHYDESVPLLVTQFVAGQDLFSHHREVWACPPDVARDSAASLAKLHLLSHPFSGGDEDGLCRGKPPWVLDIALDRFADRGPFNAAVTTLLHAIRDEPRFAFHLAKMKDEWTNRALIHGDLKWPNIIRKADGSTRLIDWEHCDIGDPAWDVGSFLHSYLEFWILALPLDATEDALEAADRAAWDFDGAQQAMRAFWQVYEQQAGPLADDFPTRSAKAAGARLLQTAYEQAHASDQISSQIRVMLQVGLNLLEDPEGSPALLGLE